MKLVVIAGGRWGLGAKSLLKMIQPLHFGIEEAPFVKVKMHPDCRWKRLMKLLMFV